MSYVLLALAALAAAAYVRRGSAAMLVIAVAGLTGAVYDVAGV